MEPMEAMQSKHMNKINDTNALIHMSAAGLLVFMTWDLIDGFYLYNWAAIVTTALLCGLLRHSIFKRTSTLQTQNFKKWKTNYAYFAGTVSGTMSVGYCYALFIGGTTIATSLAFIMALHIACVAASSVGSKKVFITSLLTLGGPFIASLFILNNPLTMTIGISITLFISALILINFSIYRSIMLGIEMTSKYENEVKVSQKYKNQFEDSTLEDRLTRIFNRRFFNLMIGEEVRRAKRVGTSLSVAIIEIDCFAAYLEHYGEAKADQCLISIAEILTKAASRGGEFITRFSHNQFALIAPNVSTDEALAFTSKLIDLVSRAKLEHQASLVESLQQVSVSIGIAEFKLGNIIDVNEIIEQAQSALRNVRQDGYNSTQVFSLNVFTNGEKNVERRKTRTSNQNVQFA
jgi:diguanylate cyclase (GGDEF)-like protein